MSNKNTGARLWFETQAEIDDYDDLMISNIELKTDNYEDENFAIVANRSRKEIMPGNHSSLFNRTIAKLESYIMNKTHMRLGEIGLSGTRSLLIDENYYIKKGLLNWGVAYLVLRELPLKNFYARSMIMTWFFFEYINVYGLPNIHGQFNTEPVLMKKGNLFEKERKIFHWMTETDNAMTVNKNGNLFFVFNIRCE
jgi:hypothetical protein